jgi:CheY-like chemotaxis protein
MNAEAAPSFRILVVDDDPYSRMVIAKLFDSLGALHVVFAGSGAEARAAMQADPALSLIVSDHYMPDGTGIHLLGELRQGRLPLPHDTYFVVSTVSTSFALTAVALALDVDSFMSKPYGKEQLAKRLFRFLSAGSPRAINPVEHYAKLDVAGMLEAAEGLDPAAPRQAPRLPMTPIRRVMPGTRLAADLTGADGHRLLQAGTPLTRHLIDRLEELGVKMVPAAPSIEGADAPPP